MRESALEGISFCLVLVLAACADGLADCSGGMVALLVGGGSPARCSPAPGTSGRDRLPQKAGQRAA